MSKFNEMHPMRWVSPGTKRLLDVGCNVGALLGDCRENFPSVSLAGVDVNAAAIEKAKLALPGASIHQIHGVELPFEDASFDCVTCIEVLEHIPADLRPGILREIERVLTPGGLFVIRTPHSGMFDWLDSNNLRFRLPGFYKLLVRRGLRDSGYAGGSADVIWHHHFSKDELLSLMHPALRLEETHYGGLLLFPLMDILRWPFYRLRKLDSPVLRGMDRIMEWDIGVNYGQSSFTILFTLRKPA